jgi:pimeloyl-ACP methyl ester carboxylesterase
MEKLMTPPGEFIPALVKGYVESRDGYRVSYRCEGEGPAVMLIHGGGDTKDSWWRVGYPDRLAGRRIIAPDIRGNGESDKPPRPDDYYIDTIVDDLLRVADACAADRFTLIGFSFGGDIAKHLAATSDRVEKLVMIGSGFGASAFGVFAERLPAMRRRFKVLAEELDHSVLDFSSLTPTERIWVEKFHLPSWVHILAQLSHWPPVRPGDLRCPALLIVGSGNADAMAQAERYRGEMAEAGVKLEVLEVSSHYKEFTDVDSVFPAIQRFLNT